jgi:cyclic-di-GMP-binding protein
MPVAAEVVETQSASASVAIPEPGAFDATGGSAGGAHDGAGSSGVTPGSPTGPPPRGATNTKIAAITPMTAASTVATMRVVLSSPGTDTFYHDGMADSSFDVVSKVDPMEIQNALGQAQKEIQQRYDFKGVDASIEMSGEKILMKANAEERVKAVLEVFEQKLIKRSISLRSLDAGKPFPSGKEYRIEAAIKQGISSEDAKKIAKIIRDEAPKSVKSQIQGDELRVQSKSRDDLQQTIALLKGQDLDVALQFINFR